MAASQTPVLRTPMVRIKRFDGQVFVSFAVKVIDVQSFAVVADELDEIVRHPNPQVVVIDLAGIKRLDQWGLFVLQALRESIKEVGGKVKFSGSRDPIDRAVNENRLAKDIDDLRSLRSPPKWISSRKRASIG